MSVYTHHQGKPVGTQVFGDRYVRGCTGKQAAFINRLLEERVHTLPYKRAEDINIRHASRVIEHLLAQPKNAAAPARPATTAQVAFVLSLAPARQGGAELLSKHDMAALAFDDASLLITTLKALPLRTTTIEVGAYRHDGVVWSVRSNLDNDRLYAVRWLGNGWSARDYKVVLDMTQAERLTLSEAKEFGVLTGCCCHCGRTLTDQKSVTAGIGPVCAQRYQ